MFRNWLTYFDIWQYFESPRVILKNLGMYGQILGYIIYLRLSLFKKCKIFIIPCYFWKIECALKPSFFSHSKPRTRLLKCFVLITLCCKTKHLWSLVWDLVRGFGWLEILGFSILSRIICQEICLRLVW